MYCVHCGVHFSGQGTTGRCPYCGHRGEPTRNAATAPSSGPSSGPSKPRGPGSREAPPDPDETRTEAATADLWSIGSLVAGKYEVLERLGAGGFGTVYKVRHIYRKKYYALKTPHAEFVRDPMFRRRFEREIEAMERFVHPDAVMIRDSGITEDGRPYYTMDFIEGESLKTVLVREGKLPYERALSIAVRILHVLDIAHAHDIIHRDIKPDNILLTQSGGRETVKVLDFGVAKLLDLVGETGSITHGQRIGTPKYMSPEQITGEQVDGRSDLFALGIVLYEMVTGQHPFAQVRDPIRITGAILNRDPVSPRELVPELPKPIHEAILSMLEKRLKRRPASAAALLKQLGALSEEVSRVEEPVQCVEIHSGVSRGPAEPLVLCQETSAGERRCFLLFDERVTFGRSSVPPRRGFGHLIVRCLPCRSQVLDGDNWQRNLTISQVVGTVYPDGAALVIEPSSGTGYGIAIGGVRSQRTARLQTDRFALSLGERALDLDGYRQLRSKDEPDCDLSCLQTGRPPGLEAPLLTGFSNGGCQIDAVSFFRPGNWPLHEYYLVYRMLRIGSAASSPLRLRGREVEGAHAAIVYESGESFLLALEGEVRVIDAGEEDLGASVPQTEERIIDLSPRTLLPIRPGMEIQIGDNRLTVARTTDTHFKTT